jgi:hypothetical protein
MLKPEILNTHYLLEAISKILCVVILIEAKNLKDQLEEERGDSSSPQRVESSTDEKRRDPQNDITQGF